MPRRFCSPSLKSLLILAPALGLIVAGSPAASAAPAVPAAPVIPAAQVHPLTSTWNGYADTNSSGNSYQEASGSWVQPKITCGASSTTGSVYWVGLDGYTSASVEQVGTYAVCESGTAYYFSWWEMYPTDAIQIVGETVKPGDHITASVTKSGNDYVLKLTDATTSGNSFTTTQACASCSGASAEWVQEPMGTPVVGSWTVTGATVKSGSVTGVIATFPHVAIGTAGSLNAAGNGFTVP
jgi:hypothetical protein